MYDKQALIVLVRQKALKFGDFTLASGKKAKYYLDGKQVTLDPTVTAAGGRRNTRFAGGRAAAVGHRRDVDRRRSDHGGRGHHVGRPRARRCLGFMVRKEGGGARHQSIPRRPRKRPAQTAVIVEDVVTTGGSSLRAIERAEDLG